MRWRHRFTVLFATVLVAAACGGGEAEETTTTGGDEPAVTTTEAPEEETTTTAAPAEDDGTTTTAAEETTAVHASDSDFGEILVGPDGFTLYIFTNDSEGESVCYDACADLWPPLPADTAVSSELDQGIFGSIERDDGTQQLTVNGMPLYFYEPDTEPGDVEGQGFNGVWFVVDAEGNVIEAEAGEDDDVVIDYDY